MYMGCRSLDRAEQAATKIKEISGSDKVSILQLDLASLESVRKCAQEFKQSECLKAIFFYSKVSRNGLFRHVHGIIGMSRV